MTHTEHPTSRRRQPASNGSPSAAGSWHARRSSCARTTSWPPSAVRCPGPCREALCLRRPEWTADARRSLRRSQPADRVSLHVRPGSEGRLCRLLLRRGSHRRRHAAHQRTRHHGRGVLARADRADRAVPTPHGLALQVGIVESQRLQQRLPRVVHEGRSRERSHVLQLRETLVPVGRRGARTERFLQGRDRGIFHTYSAYARGLEVLDGAYHFIDLAPKGRDEEGLPFPGAWWRHHDRYAADTIQARHAE